MADKIPPDNPIKEVVNKAAKPKVVDIRGRGNTKQTQQDSNPNDVIEWESKSGDYQIINGAFNQIRSTRDGIAKINLIN